MKKSSVYHFSSFVVGAVPPQPPPIAPATSLSLSLSLFPSLSLHASSDEAPSNFRQRLVEAAHLNETSPENVANTLHHKRVLPVAPSTSSTPA